MREGSGKDEEKGIEENDRMERTREGHGEDGVSDILSMTFSPSVEEDQEKGLERMRGKP
jgi:hypothetical protein